MSTSARLFIHRIAHAIAGVSLLCGVPLAGHEAATPLREDIDAARLRARRDSFTVIKRGTPRGWQVLSTERDGAGWVLGDALPIGGMMSQSSVIRLDAQPVETSLRQQGTMRGKPIRITLDRTGCYRNAASGRCRRRGH